MIAKALKRYTAEFVQNPKEKYIIDAQQYELDEKQIYDFYSIIPKEIPKYNVIKKQVAFGKDIAHTKLDKNKKYSNYTIFRDFMQKEIDIEDIKSDIEQVKYLINKSESTRYKFYSYFRMDRADYIKSYDYTKFINIRSKQGQNTNSKKNNEALPNNDFLRKCIMLRRKKDDEDNKERQKTFTLFSDLDVKSTKFDAINFLVNKNKLSEKYFEQKQKLIRCYNREERFINFNKLIKQSVIQEAPDSLKKNTKDKYSSNYFDSIYDKREETFYKKIDNFFAKYEITNYKLKNEESDFYGKIYGILCKNNYLKFLSYLYSKNDIFKFIYDQFSDKDALNMDNSIEDILKNNNFSLSEKNSEENGLFFGGMARQKELGNNFGKKNNFEEEKREENVQSEKNKNLMELIVNNYAYIKIGFINEKIKFKYIKEFCESEENEEDEDDENRNNKKDNRFYQNYLKKCAKEPLNHILLITSNKKLVIKDDKLSSLFEQKMSEISFIKINKDYLKIVLNNKVKSLYPSNIEQAEFYLIENKIDNEKKEYYLIKIPKKSIQSFDKQMTDNKFSLYKIKDFLDELGIKNTTLSKKETSRDIEKENEKDEQKEKDSEKDKESIKKEIKEKMDNIKPKDESIEEKEKSEKTEKSENSEKSEKEEIKEEQKEEQFAKPTPFNQDEIESEKYSASILNDDDDNQIEDLMKTENIKKSIEYQRDHKNYEFEINHEKYFFDIFQGQLRCKKNNSNVKTYELYEINPENVKEDKEHSCYKMYIYRGKKLIYKIYSQDKNNLDNFYDDIIKTKKQFDFKSLK